MSYTGAITTIRALIDAQSAEPPWRYAEDQDLDKEPFGTAATHRYCIEDRGKPVAGPLVGPASGVRMETRTLAIVARYCQATDRAALETRIHTDHRALTNLLIDRTNWDGSAHIAAILAVDNDISIDRKGPNWKTEMTYKVIIRA